MLYIHDHSCSKSGRKDCLCSTRSDYYYALPPAPPFRSSTDARSNDRKFLPSHTLLYSRQSLRTLQPRRSFGRKRVNSTARPTRSSHLGYPRFYPMDISISCSILVEDRALRSLREWPVITIQRGGRLWKKCSAGEIG